LHPDNQRILCDLVFRLAAKRGFQALISTHSRHVLDSVKQRGGAIVWLSKGVKVQTTDINTTEVLLDLGALDSVDYFADGELRCVVATEDTDTDALKAILWSNGFVEDDTEVASYAGCTKAEAAIVLGRFVMDKAPHVRLVVHRDRDYMSADEANRFKERLGQEGIAPLLTTDNDIESHFISVAHLNALNPALSEAQIQQLIDQATAETSQQSIAAIVNLRTQEAFKFRQAGGPTPDHGAIAVQAQADYATNPAVYRRGKVVLGRLVALLQQELKANPRVYSPSPHLKRPEAASLAAAIWALPEPAVAEVALPPADAANAAAAAGYGKLAGTDEDGNG
jgi:hypothetical protein